MTIMTSLHRIARLRRVLVLALAATALPVGAQEPPKPLKLTVHALKHGAYWVEGGTSNTGFIVGDTGVIIYDAQMKPEAVAQELAAIKTITPKPIDQIIASHGDPDHVGGLSFYPAGKPIIMHENTRSKITASAADTGGGPVYGAIYKKLLDLPIRTVSSTETDTIDGVKLVLMYVGPAHTSGDLIVYVPASKVVYGGDIVLTNNGRFPIIHLTGSSLGWVAAMKAILALDADIIIPGHGPVETKAQLTERVRDVEERRTAIKAMVAANKTLPEIEAALPDPGANPRFLSFTHVVYNELTTGYPQQTPPWFDLVKK